MSKKVLIVDDDPVVRILVSEFLCGQGYDVQAVDNGTACLEQLNQDSPDVLVLDLMMPDITGIDVLKSIRDNPSLSKLPIVMLSADTDTETVVMNNDVSADCYVQKPFEMRDILSALSKLPDLEKCS